MLMIRKVLLLQTHLDHPAHERVQVMGRQMLHHAAADTLGADDAPTMQLQLSRCVGRAHSFGGRQ